MVPLRGHAPTHLAGGPAIATLTAVLLLSWRTSTDVTAPWRYAVERRLVDRPVRTPEPAAQ
jgi:hypothetical protein